MKSRAEADTYLRKVHKVRTLLMESWDPIGVRDVPEAQDEYDAYIPQILSLIESAATTDAIAHHLADIASSKMGLAPDSERDRSVATRLLQLAID